jgi:hypothetical protein
LPVPLFRQALFSAALLPRDAPFVNFKFGNHLEVAATKLQDAAE